jgi:hypothetical protein
MSTAEATQAVKHAFKLGKLPQSALNILRKWFDLIIANREDWR